MINYLEGFIWDFSTLSYPIYKLFHPDIKYEWSGNFEESFQTLILFRIGGRGGLPYQVFSGNFYERRN